MNIKNEFTTKDFYLSAYLLSQGLRLVRLDKSEPRKVYFVFHDVEARASLVEDFLFGRAQVEPKQFVAAIKEVKQLLYTND